MSSPDVYSFEGPPETENKTTSLPHNLIGLLVISDDPALRESLDRQLHALGLDPRWATDFGDALNGGHGVWQPRAVVLDLLLPRMERYHTCREVKAALGIPVIIVDDSPPPAQSERLVADLFLGKPLTAESIWASVRAVIVPDRASYRRSGDGNFVFGHPS